MKYKIREKLFGANKASATGTSLTLNDTVKYPVNKLTIDGVCEQKTTTGKNLLPKTTKITQTINGITFNINEDGTIVANGTASDKATLYLGNGTTLASGTYTTSSGLNGTSGVRFGLEAGNNYLNTNTSRTDTFDSEITIKNSYYQIDSGINVNNLILKPMIEQGSEATDYEHYTGGQPSPSPDYPQNISVLTGNLKLTSCGKNLFKMGTVNDYDYNNRITNITADKISIKLFGSGLTFTYNKLNKFKGNKIYYITALSEVSNARFFIRLRNSDDTGWLNSNDVNLAGMEYISVFNGWYYNCSDINMKKIISIPDCLYWELGFGFHSSAGTIGESYTISNIMVSNADSSYEPYQGSSLNIAIPSNEFVGKLDDTYKDTLNVVYKDDGHYHLILKKMIGKVVLNGSEGNIYAFYENPGDYNQINATLGITNIDTTNKYDFRCNYFGYYEKATGNKTRSGMVKYGTNPNFVFSVPKTIITATSTWRNWISTHNVIIYYPFATSYEVDLGIVDTLLSYDEITNIFTDSDLYPVINVKYYNGSLDISNYEFSIKEV